MSKKILPPTYLLITLALIVLLHFILPLVTFQLSGWRLLGLLPLVFGIIINVVADRAFHEVDTTVKPFEESTVLITGGAYRLSRHPMYLGFVLILIGVAILLGSLSPWLIILVFAILMDRFFIIVEENMLEKKFGQEWLVYKRKVRRWF